jgi:hypothetical protein
VNHVGGVDRDQDERHKRQLRSGQRNASC